MICKLFLNLCFLCMIMADVREILPFRKEFGKPFSSSIDTPTPVPILRQESNINPDGTYNYHYETANGIVAHEQANWKSLNQQDGDVLEVQGQFSYVGPEGQPITLTYVADENGFHPQGEHLPTPPPIPEAIQRALNYIASQPQSLERYHIKRNV